MRATFATFASLALLVLGSRDAAPQSAARCAKIDTKATWYRDQRAAATDVAHDWSNDSLRTVLLTLVPPAASFTPQLGWQTLDASTPVRDSAALRTLGLRLRAMGQKRAWIGRADVGAAGVHALALIARGDTSLATMALHRMMESGPGDAAPADVALLEDLVRLRAGRKQLYGTVLVPGDGSVKWKPAPIEDPDHVDLRRDAASLPPLAVALCDARSRAK